MGLSRAVCSVCQGMSGSWLKQILRYLPLEEPKSNKLFDTSSKQVSTCNLSYVTCLVIFGLWKITAWLVYVSCCWAIRQYFSGCGVFKFWKYDQTDEAGVCCGPCNPSKWEADIWGWLEVRGSAILHYTVNQHPHWACWQYGHTSGGTQGWLGVERWQLCLQDTYIIT